MRTANAALTGGSIVAAVLVAVGLGTSTTEPVLAQAGTLGSWRTVVNQVPINPVHAALLRNGQVLMVAGSGNVATETNFLATVWDPATETFATQALGWDMFCNGMVTLHDGRVLVNGGNLQYDPFFGEPRNAVFDPATGLFSNIENMARGRWYPTVTTLGDGRVMTFSGLLEVGGTNTAVEIYTVGSGWSQQYPAGWTPPLYPRLHLSTDGRVFFSGSSRSSRFFNPSTGAWSSVATTNHSASRTYGTSVLLPLTPANGYRPRVMIFGGGNPATPTTEIIDLSATTPAWQFGPSMSQPRIQMNATILPNGKVLATGGSTNDEDALTASRNADLYDPVTNTFSSAGTNAFPRLYHSNALLLPDATVLLMGGNPQRGNYEKRLEIYSPAYLFNGDGTSALRPSISGVTPETVSYNSPFAVQTPDASDIASVVLVRPGTPTHAFDMEQRLVGLSFSAGTGVLNVTTPPNGNIAPPGYYMLFVLNSAGVPSVARFVRLVPTAANQAPVATIVNPAGNVTVNPGGTVSFSGTGTDGDGSVTAYSWTFAGGVPGSSSSATAGSVSYSTPGSYTASFTVTDDKGLASQPVTRTVTVSNFTLSATPASQTVTVGQNATYTATVPPASGFTGTVDFSVTGLPSGAIGTFTPPSVAGSGSSALMITTTGVAPGSYPLVIRGTSGPISRTAGVTLIINAPVNQAPVATITSPAGNVAVNPGGQVAFSGNGTDSDGNVTAYSWTFAGGVPGSSSFATPGSVSYSTPGSYAASLTVTDDKGLASQPVTRTVTVSNFTLSATPASQTVMPGQNATYSATVTPVSGFTGVVDFTVTGLPSGAVGTFTPASVAGSGTTTLLISTSGVPSGSYPLVIRGTSGPISRSVNVTLTINGEFTISATPSSWTINRGDSTTYTVTIATGAGFSGPLNLTVAGLPQRTTATFNPASLAGSGTSVLTVSTTRNAQKGTRTLTITGSGGGRIHSVNVTLVVK